MQFESWQVFWYMGGYVFYVWVFFGVIFLVMGLIVLNSMMIYKKLFKEVVQEVV